MSRLIPLQEELRGIVGKKNYFIFISVIVFFSFIQNLFANEFKDLKVKFWIYPMASQIQWLTGDNVSSVIFYLEYNEDKTQVTKFEAEVMGKEHPQILKLKEDKSYLLEALTHIELPQVLYLGLYGETEVDPLQNFRKKREEQIIPLFKTIRWGQMRYIIKQLETQKDVDLYLVKHLLYDLLGNEAMKNIISPSSCDLFLTPSS